MTERVIGPTGSPRRRWTLLVPLVVVIALGLFYVAGAQAVHDEDFQLDGDVLASTTTNIGGNLQSIDWDSLFDADGEEKSLPANFTESGFDRDFETHPTTGNFVTSDTSTFATGSKDTLPISGWQCNRDNNVNSKIDVMNAYAAEYVDPVTEDEILYFGLERNVNTGDANVGFWFLQDAVACESTGAAVTFSGEHQDGDLLVVSEFSGGGDVSTINAYRWNRFTGDCDATPVDCVINPPGVPGSLGTTPVADGVDCRDPALPAPDETCGAANRDEIETPWLTAAKTTVGHTLPEAQFFEGGVNLTLAELAGRCFNTFIADTRSSTSLTATLFDFSLGQLGECVPGMTTQASTNGTVAPGTGVTDTATIQIEGAANPDDPTGDVTFFLCGPIATGDCSTGGTNIGTGELDGGTITDDGLASAVSPAVNTAASPLGAGRYCFRAEWPGDDNYEGVSHTDDDLECFSVQDTSSVTTEQDWLPNDTATITSAGDSNLTGNVIFELYESDDCTGTAVFTETDALAAAASPAETSTANSTVYTDNVTVSWKVRFDSTADGVSDSDPVCETSSIANLDNDVPIGP
jgi:hypothetical protein